MTALYSEKNAEEHVVLPLVLGLFVEEIPLGSHPVVVLHPEGEGAGGASGREPNHVSLNKFENGT